ALGPQGPALPGPDLGVARRALPRSGPPAPAHGRRHARGGRAQRARGGRGGLHRDQVRPDSGRVPGPDARRADRRGGRPGRGRQFVRPDVGLTGGPTHCKKIAAIAESFHAAVVTHNFLGPVLTAASAHLDVAIPNFVVQEYSKIDERQADAFPGTLKREGGYLPLPEAPGLGVRIDEAKLAEVGRPMLDPGRLPLRSDGSVAYSV